MSSFQRFKKDLNQSRSRKSQNSSRNSFQNIAVSLDRLIISSPEIIFNYGPSSQVLFGSPLTLSNQTNVKLFVKIRSNNPLMYTITPQQEIIQINQNLKIEIKVKITSSSDGKIRIMSFSELEQMMKYDKFEIQWAEISQTQIKGNVIPALTKKQTISVRILNAIPAYSEKKSTLKVQNTDQKPKFNYYNQNYDWKDSKTQKIDTSNNMLGLNKKYEDYGNENINDWNKSREVGNKINSQMFDQPKGSLLTGPIIAGVAIISFLIGFATA